MLLGHLHLRFQLNMKTPHVIMKGGMAKEEGVASRNMASSGPEEGGTSTPPQFVVGPGASFKKARRARTLSPPSMVGESREEVEEGRSEIPSKRPPLVRGTMKSPDTRAEAKPPPPYYSTAAEWREREERDEGVLPIGREQLVVIGELIERGTRLRERMVQSLMGEHQQQQSDRYMCMTGTCACTYSRDQLANGCCVTVYMYGTVYMYMCIV